MDKIKIPVTVVTGFLGAGKTTFINNLLQKYQTIRFALVENEFGDVQIDTKLIKGVDASQMFELRQGCICCTISDEFELVLKELAERFPNIEHLLIETTGIANPAQVIQPFFRDKDLNQIYRFNGTVCLVDALYHEVCPEKEITLNQLVVADLLFVSKAENLSVSKKSNIKKELRKINRFASIIFNCENDFLLNSLQKGGSSGFNFAALPQEQSFGSTHSQIQTKTLLIDKPVDRNKFTRWLAYTLDIYKKQIYRTKGILCFAGEPYEYILQGVGAGFELIEGDLILSDAKSEVVFIGKLEGAQLDFQ